MHCACTTQLNLNVKMFHLFYAAKMTYFRKQKFTTSKIIGKSLSFLKDEKKEKRSRKKEEKNRVKNFRGVNSSKTNFFQFTHLIFFKREQPCHITETKFLIRDCSNLYRMLLTLRGSEPF